MCVCVCVCLCVCVLVKQGERNIHWEVKTQIESEVYMQKEIERIVMIQNRYNFSYLSKPDKNIEDMGIIVQNSAMLHVRIELGL